MIFDNKIIRFELLTFAEHGTYAPFNSLVVRKSNIGYTVHYYHTVTNLMGHGSHFGTLAEAVRFYRAEASKFRKAALELANLGVYSDLVQAVFHLWWEEDYS